MTNYLILIHLHNKLIDLIVYDVPRRTMRVNTRRATMLAGLIAPRLRLGFVSASISCEHFKRVS